MNVPALLILYILSFSSCLHASIPDEKSKVLIFDFGGVIVSPDKTDFFEFIQQTFRLDDHTLRHVRTRFISAKKANISEHLFWMQISEELNVPLQEDWEACYDHAKLYTLNENPGIRDLIKSYREKGYRIGLLSNVTTDHANFLRRHGYYEGFSPLLLSCEIGVDKPDPEAYRILLAQLGVEPKNCIFIDDKQINIDAAIVLGIDAILFSNHVQLQGELNRRLKQ